jgi:hypothetical protein
MHILNLGAGVQSTTLYLMFMRGEIRPQIDCAIFADTQEEPAAVYQHLKWLQSLNGPPILVRTAGRLGDDLIAGRRTNGQGKNRFATIPAFTMGEDGNRGGMQMRQCSRDYKTAVIDLAIRRELLNLAPRHRVSKTLAMFQYLGISFDEGGRARRIQSLFAKKQKWSTPVFPLIERFMTRADCLTWLAKYGNVPHQTPRSACVFCPYHTDSEWNRIKSEDPEGWQRAIEIDRALRIDGTAAKRGLDGKLYLHRSCKPLDLVQLDTRPTARDLQMPMSFYQECEGVCGV